MSVCRICNNSQGSSTYTVREMMFGLREPFKYIECSLCGCLQIEEIPGNMARFYPETYFSFSSPHVSRQSSLISFFKRRRLLFALGGPTRCGALFSKLFGHPHLPDWVKKAKLRPESHILDVGCGAGHLLLSLKKKGFAHLIGVDPFIKDDIFYKNGVQIFKKRVEDIEEEFDFIMLHHSFEHMPHPLPVLHHLYRILKHNRSVLIRVPVAATFAWREYKTNWVQIDAPRHLFLHSVKSIRLLAGQAGFTIEHIIFDSTALQFWGSKQYVRDIPFMDSRSYNINPGNSIFSDEEIKGFQKKAEELNINRDGDTACFYLYKK